MKKFLLISFFVAAVNTFVCAQVQTPNKGELKTVEIYSPWDFSGERPKSSPELRAKSCLDLLLLERRCGATHSISYGDRLGKNWDIFDVEGSQTRMIDLGEYKWTDKFEVPVIRPWAKLKPGEGRQITLNTSGGRGADGRDGADGLPGMNGDGTYDDSLPIATLPRKPRPGTEGYGNKPVAQQVSSKVKAASGVERPDDYNPLAEARKGHMYAIRLVDPENDYYMLMRVDDIVRGTKVTISFRKMDVPPQKSIY
jgi:hypothetical protein